MTIVQGFSTRTKNKIVYPSCDSALKPVPRTPNEPIPVPPLINAAIDEDEDVDAIFDEDEAQDDTYKPPDDCNKKMHLIEQEELNDLVRDLGLSKEKSELLGSRFQQWNLLRKGTKISIFRSRQQNLAKFYKFDEKIAIATTLMV